MIPGAKSEAQLRENAAAGDGRRPDDVVRALDALWERELRDDPGRSVALVAGSPDVVSPHAPSSATPPSSPLSAGSSQLHLDILGRMFYYDGVGQACGHRGAPGEERIGDR